MKVHAGPRIITVIVVVALCGSVNAQKSARPQTKVQGQSNQRKNVQSKLAIAKLQKIRVVPNVHGASFRFIARADAVPVQNDQRYMPVVDVAKDSPIIIDKKVTIVSPLIHMKVTRDNQNSNAIATEYAGLTNVFAPLEPGTLYHYVVTVPSHDGSLPEQQIGQFMTTKQTVKVSIGGVRISSSGEAGSNGAFAFTVNPGQPGEGRKTWSGSTAGPIARVATSIVIDNSNDQVTVHVDGCSGSAPQVPDELLTAPLKGPGYECNVATGTFDIGALPGPNPTLPFSIPSFGLGPHGVTFLFDVSGSLEVIRE